MEKRETVLLIWDCGEGNIQLFLLDDPEYMQLAMKCHKSYVNADDSPELDQLYDLIENQKPRPASIKLLPWDVPGQLTPTSTHEKLILVQSGYC